jgi:hypothetical protein
MKQEMRIPARWRDGFDGLRTQSGKVGWILLWLLGVPIPVLLVLFLLRGCT